MYVLSSNQLDCFFGDQLIEALDQPPPTDPVEEVGKRDAGSLTARRGLTHRFPRQGAQRPALFNHLLPSPAQSNPRWSVESHFASRALVEVDKFRGHGSRSLGTTT